jgi:hypothetical protein
LTFWENDEKLEITRNSILTKKTTRKKFNIKKDPAVPSEIQFKNFNPFL